MNQELIEGIVSHFGKESQVAKAIEEMGELITELARSQNGKASNVNILGEIADVSIMVAQLRYIYGADQVDHHIQMKLNRIGEKISTFRFD